MIHILRLCGSLHLLDSCAHKAWSRHLFLSLVSEFSCSNFTCSCSRFKGHCSINQNCPLSIGSCDLLVAIFVMLKILKLLFVGRIELFNNNGQLALVKTKTTTRGSQSIMAHTGPLISEAHYSELLMEFPDHQRGHSFQ